jgi:benzoyl-CoA reductase/2-hydroxyglutaryl-CoA dehydratase subunit BcrC/BadD/HgdB
MLEADGVEVVGFGYPYGRDRELLTIQLRKLADAYGTTLAAAEDWRLRLSPVRAVAHEIDRLCWEEGKVAGMDHHLWLVSCSDFNGDPGRYEREAREFAAEAAGRAAWTGGPRLALVGIPPICDGLFDLLESYGARVVFNEVPRQFAMPEDGTSLIEQYTRYTYPYDVFRRIEDIRGQCRLRAVDGVIHYVQSFCFRQTQDTLLRRSLARPTLTLECDRPGSLDARSRTRVEAFLETLPQAQGEGGR